MGHLYFYTFTLYFTLKFVCFIDWLLRPDPKWSSVMDLLWSLSRVLLSQINFLQTRCFALKNVKPQTCYLKTFLCDPFQKDTRRHNRLISEEKDQCFCMNTRNAELFKEERTNKSFQWKKFTTHILNPKSGKWKALQAYSCEMTGMYFLQRHGGSEARSLFCLRAW